MLFGCNLFLHNVVGLSWSFIVDFYICDHIFSHMWEVLHLWEFLHFDGLTHAHAWRVMRICHARAWQGPIWPSALGKVC